MKKIFCVLLALFVHVTLYSSGPSVSEEKPLVRSGIIKLLINTGITTGNNGSFKPENGPALQLIHYIKAGHPEKAKALLETPIDVNITDEYSWTPLLWAAKKGYTDLVEKLIQHGADVNKAAIQLALVWDNKKTADLLKAAYIKKLISNKANLNTDDTVLKSTPLMWAVKQNLPNLVDLLIKARADLNKTDSLGITPLQKAATKGHKEIVAILLKAGADVNKTSKYGSTALKEALHWGHTEIAQMLQQASTKN